MKIIRITKKEMEALKELDAHTGAKWKYHLIKQKLIKRIIRGK